jgi:hypothetical protein
MIAAMADQTEPRPPLSQRDLDDLIKYGTDLDGHIRRSVLWTLPDGSIQQALRCDHGEACRRNDPTPHGAHETTEAERAEVAALYSTS